jgi:hypothetical protein
MSFPSRCNSILSKPDGFTGTLAPWIHPDIDAGGAAFEADSRAGLCSIGVRQLEFRSESAHNKDTEGRTFKCTAKERVREPADCKK